MVLLCFPWKLQNAQYLIAKTLTFGLLFVFFNARCLQLASLCPTLVKRLQVITAVLGIYINFGVFASISRW